MALVRNRHQVSPISSPISLNGKISRPWHLLFLFESLIHGESGLDFGIFWSGFENWKIGMAFLARANLKCFFCLEFLHVLCDVVNSVGYYIRDYFNSD